MNSPYSRSVKIGRIRKGPFLMMKFGKLAWHVCVLSVWVSNFLGGKLCFFTKILVIGLAFA